MYLGISKEAISSVLIQEDEKKMVQRPDTLRLKKWRLDTLGLKKWCMPFSSWLDDFDCTFKQAHLMVVLTDQPLKTLLQWLDILRRIVKWAIEFEEFNISYLPHFFIKAQVLADFIVECAIPGTNELMDLRES